MAATHNDIRNWLDRGIKDGATHVIIVCDTYDFEDYPVYVMPEQSAVEEYSRNHGTNMQKVMEVYNLSLDIDIQLSEHRAMNF